MPKVPEANINMLIPRDAFLPHNATCEVNEMQMWWLWNGIIGSSWNNAVIMKQAISFHKQLCGWEEKERHWYAFTRWKTMLMSFEESLNLFIIFAARASHFPISLNEKTCRWICYAIGNCRRRLNPSSPDRMNPISLFICRQDWVDFNKYWMKVPRAV